MPILPGKQLRFDDHDHNHGVVNKDTVSTTATVGDGFWAISTRPDVGQIWSTQYSTRRPSFRFEFGAHAHGTVDRGPVGSDFGSEHEGEGVERVVGLLSEFERWT
ncbi:hypothetical protein RHSIM_Rhsim02G0116200 [Rhododendron simsii]|uniref:Uncharacterized protein n=1 Tax=Rhododendron simsii TaxID=118357 RepID=A0A834HBH4_RHOSS|nr:hypothetical protein RHSIM_Rhsim02G0116200 [Rhododendron simsii]